VSADRIEVALDVTPLAGPLSGVGHFVVEILDALPESGSVKLVPYALSFRARLRTVSGLPPGTRLLPFPAGAAITAWARADQPTADRWLDPARVIHGTNYVTPPSRRAASVVTVHDCSFQRYPELCSPEVRRAAGALRRAVRRGAWVHTPSPFEAEEAADILATDRVVAVPHGVPRLALGAAPVSGMVGDSPFVLAVGTLEPRKNLPRLVEAFGPVASDHPGLQLVLAGATGPDRPAVEAARAALGPATSRRVKVVGYVDDRMRAALYSRAAVFAYPSIYEGFGFPLLEAMAAGTPVVAGAGGAVPEVAGDGALLVDPLDVDGLSAALSRVLDDETLRNELVRAGRRQAGRFSWRTAASGLADLYRRAAAG
jgi:glycosyltransferase involved in cell wall biosynthesis